MKIVLTGAAGNITKPLAENLLAQGHDVTVIGRSAENLKPLTDKGAKAAIGELEDEAFLTQAFKDADVVYTMLPTPFHLTDWVDYGELIGMNYAKALKANQVKKVVNLGTYGGHRTDGIGPTASIARVEKALEALENTQIILLRPGYFYSNLYNQISTIKNMGIIGGNYGDVENKLLLVHTKDIAVIAAEAMLSDNFNNGEPYYVVSDIKTGPEIAQALGKSIGNGALSWIPFTDKDTRNGLKQAGFSNELAAIYVEIGQFFAKGYLNEHYMSLTEKPLLGNIKLEDFAKDFAVVYNQN